MIEGLFSPIHLLLVGGIALLVFGPSRLPELGRGFGEAIRGFKTGLEEIGSSRAADPGFRDSTRYRTGGSWLADQDSKAKSLLSKPSKRRCVR